MLVMFSMDVCDIFLYSAQILKVVKSGGKVDYPAAVYYIGFGMIPVSWYAGPISLPRCSLWPLIDLRWWLACCL